MLFCFSIIFFTIFLFIFILFWFLTFVGRLFSPLSLSSSFSLSTSLSSYHQCRLFTDLFHHLSLLWSSSKGLAASKRALFSAWVASVGILSSSGSTDVMLCVHWATQNYISFYALLLTLTSALSFFLASIFLLLPATDSSSQHLVSETCPSLFISSRRLRPRALLSKHQTTDRGVGKQKGGLRSTDTVIYNQFAIMCIADQHSHPLLHFIISCIS